MDLPPADAHNSADDIANTPTPVPPKKTGGAVKNRKRSLSYKPRKGTNNQKRSASLHPPNPSASTAAPSDASQQQDIAALATDSPEFKLTTKKEILKLLRQSQKDLAEAQNSIRQKDATIKQLTKKNDLLLQTTKSARSAARETKNHAKKLEELVNQQSVQLRRTDAEWDVIVRDAVSKAREEEKVRRLTA
jgi:hypothetical protein